MTSTIRLLEGEPVTKKVLDVLDLAGFNNLMIVAHSDDEVFWGGRFLLEGGWLVLCMTSGVDAREKSIRPLEFKNAVDFCGNRGLILSHYDSMDVGFGTTLPAAAQDTKTVLRYKPWKKIVTHGCSGEYGHIQHIQTSEIVTKQAKSLKIEKTVWHFVYPGTERTVDEATEQRLNDLVGCYPSQKAVTCPYVYHLGVQDIIRLKNHP